MLAMESLKSKILLIGAFLFVTEFSASAQSLMSLIGSQSRAIEGKWETNPGSKVPELNFYNHDYCDFYLVRRSNGKSYDLHPGRNTVNIRSGRNRHVREKCRNI